MYTIPSLATLIVGLKRTPKAFVKLSFTTRNAVASRAGHKLSFSRLAQRNDAHTTYSAASCHFYPGLTSIWLPKLYIELPSSNSLSLGQIFPNQDVVNGSLAGCKQRYGRAIIWPLIRRKLHSGRNISDISCGTKSPSPLVFELIRPLHKTRLDNCFCAGWQIKYEASTGTNTLQPVQVNASRCIEARPGTWMPKPPCIRCWYHTGKLANHSLFYYPSPLETKGTIMCLGRQGHAILRAKRPSPAMDASWSRH